MLIHVHRLIVTILVVLLLLVPAGSFADTIYFPVGGVGGGGGGGGTGPYVGPSAPASPTLGLLWSDTSTTPPTLRVWDGSAWIGVSDTGAGGNPVIGPIAPTNPTEGLLWYDTSTTPSTLRVWDGANWDVVSNITDNNSGTTPPANPARGQIWYDTSTVPATLKVWDGTAWIAVGGTGGGGEAVVGPTAPTSPIVGQMWFDTSVTPPMLKVWDGTAWVAAHGVPSGAGTFQDLNVGPGSVSVTGSSNNGTDQISGVSVNGVANVKAYGAKGDVMQDWGGSCSLPASSNALTCSAGAFKPTDVGKRIFVPDFLTRNITGAVAGGGGRVRLTVNSTTGLNTANVAVVRSIQIGTVEANGVWNFTIINATQLELTGSTFTHAWQVSPMTATVQNIAAPTLDTTITAYTSPTQVTIGTTRTVAATGQTAFWATDDTAAIQNAYNDPSTGTLYFPPGSYFNRGQNWVCGRNPQYGCKGMITGTAWGGGSSIFNVGVTNPGGIPGATKVGIQHASYIDDMRDLTIWGGFWGAPDTAPTINFLSARVLDQGSPNVSSGTNFDIDHNFNRISFTDTGINGNNVVLYGSEQVQFHDCVFGNGYAGKSVLQLSQCNTQGFIAPYATFVAPSNNSMTFVGTTGRSSVVAGWNTGNQNGGGLVFFDNACNPWAPYAVNLDDIYVNQGNSTFLADNYAGTDTVARMRHINIRNFYSEPNTTADQATNIHALAEGWDIQGQFYAGWGFIAGDTRWQFGLGFISSSISADTTGNAAGVNSTFSAQTCKGSTFNLTQTGGITGCSDWLYSNGYNQPFGANNDAQVQPDSLGVLNHFGSSGASVTPSVVGGYALAGSSDSFGWITANTSNRPTLVFTKPWGAYRNGVSVPVAPVCTLTDGGQPMLWFTETGVGADAPWFKQTFVCVDPTTLAPCPVGEVVQYHCIGMGGT